MKKICELCEKELEEQFFRDGNAICIYCEAEIESVGEPITKENLGEIIQKQWSKK